MIPNCTRIKGNFLLEELLQMQMRMLEGETFISFFQSKISEIIFINTQTSEII